MAMASSVLSLVSPHSSEIRKSVGETCKLRRRVDAMAVMSVVSLRNVRRRWDERSGSLLTIIIYSETKMTSRQFKTFAFGVVCSL
jgi:hypothetical protein